MGRAVSARGSTNGNQGRPLLPVAGLWWGRCVGRVSSHWPGDVEAQCMALLICMSNLIELLFVIYITFGPKSRKNRPKDLWNRPSEGPRSAPPAEGGRAGRLSQYDRRPAGHDPEGIAGVVRSLRIQSHGTMTALTGEPPVLPRLQHGEPRQLSSAPALRSHPAQGRLLRSPGSAAIICAHMVGVA